MNRALLVLFVPFVTSLCAAAPDYAAVHALFQKHCLDCHAAQEPEGGLVLETHAALLRGGQNGAALVPGKSADSLLVKALEGTWGGKGKNRFMPPGRRERLAPADIALIRAWVDAGAPAPTNAPGPLLSLPKIPPKTPPRRAVNALAFSPAARLLAAARPGEVELRAADSREVLRTLPGHRGSVTALAFSSDGRHLFAAAGEPGLIGEVRQWRVADGALVRVIEASADALYALALSPDGRVLATGGYDQKIRLWSADDGRELKTLSGHNGCVFDLAFRPDGKILASASADRTVKLWDAATGARRDTLAQPLKEQFTLAFSPDGTRLVAGGADNRLRVWRVSAGAAETTNPLLASKFAHEGAILRLAFSPDGRALATSADDRTVKLWDITGEPRERRALPPQPDWAQALCFGAEGKTLHMGRLDGTLETGAVGE